MAIPIILSHPNMSKIPASPSGVPTAVWSWPCGNLRAKQPLSPSSDGTPLPFPSGPSHSEMEDITTWATGLHSESLCIIYYGAVLDLRHMYSGTASTYCLAVTTLPMGIGGTMKSENSQSPLKIIIVYPPTLTY